ncbi:MAG: DUF4336 domain-containing protein [Cyanobacteriota bacterium]
MTVSATDQRWPWWPLLPLYPYGHRRTLVRELIPGRIWSFEQLQGIFYVAVPIRMTVLKVADGLLLYGAVPPTGEVLAVLRDLEAIHGPVRTLVLGTSSGLEHKLPMPALARAFPKADLWVSPGQWSFPVSLPATWLGFPASRTRVLGQDGWPHEDQLRWTMLGPLDLGVGAFAEAACFDRHSGSLLLTDALVAPDPTPPPLFDADPTPLLFHARELGSEPLQDSPEARQRGWRRLLLFASFLRPSGLRIPTWREVFTGALRPGTRQPRAYFGLYPFRWQPDWERDLQALVPEDRPVLQVAPVLERLVFPRQRQPLVAWIRQLATLENLRWVVPAHYAAPVPCSSRTLADLADQLERRPWAPDAGPWAFLSSIDQALLRWGVVPAAGDGH